MVRAADMALAVDMARAVDMVRAGGVARWGRAAAEMWEKCGEKLDRRRAGAYIPGINAMAGGTGGGAAVGEMFTGAGAGAMTYLIFRRLHYGSI